MGQVNLYGFERVDGDEIEIEEISADGSEIVIVRWLDGADESENVVISVPSSWHICGECNGEGMSLCDGLRGVAISGEEMARDWDDDERAAYFGGGYDTRCDSCSGTGKVKYTDELTDENGAPEWLIELVADHWRQESYFAAESEAERRMGC